MSHSRKDGVRKGAHRDTWCREVWSKRCHLVNMWRRNGDGVKRITHRYERRMARRDIDAQLREVA